MVKLGRNDKCRCGSGKKYKKCCMEKDNLQDAQQMVPENGQAVKGKKPFHLLSYEEVDALDTDEIMDRLKELGVPFEKDAFLSDVETYFSAEEISENWFRQYNLSIKGRMEDFPWFAARVLWVRMAPAQNLSMEEMDDLLDRGIAHMKVKNYVSGCDLWLELWEGIKYRIVPSYKDLGYLGEHYDGSFFVRNFVQDLEMELHNAGLDDPIYFEKRIAFCKEFCEFFPSEDKLILHSMGRAIADSYGELGQYDKAEARFQQLVDDFPDNHWSYTGWGDFLFLGMRQDYERAKDLYEKVLVIANDSGDHGEKETVKEKLANLNEVL